MSAALGFRTFRSPVVCVALLALAAAGVLSSLAALRADSTRPAQLESSTQQPAVQPTPSAAPSWWFRYDAPTGVAQTFHATLEATATDGQQKSTVQEEADFTVAILPPTPGQPGCVIRLLPPPAQDAGETKPLIHLYLSALSAANPDGLWVSPSEICVCDAPLLRGPWRAGDRFTIFGFGAWVLVVLNDYAFGTAHFEVDLVTSTEARLNYVFWAGRSGPALRGEGELVFENDAQGITAVRAQWTRTLGPEERDVLLVIERTRVSQL